MHIVFVMAKASSVPYFNWFAKRAKESEHTFSFISLNKTRPDMLDEMKAVGWNAYWIQYDSEKRKRGMIRSFFKMFFLFRKLSPDVVHTHLFDDSVPGLLAARIAGVKKRVITKQDTTFHWYYARKWVLFDKFNNWNATHIHAVASENKDFILQKEKANPAKVHLVRNGFPLEVITNWDHNMIDSLKKEYQLEDRIVVGTVARYIHWKGHHLIIEAAKKLVSKYPKLLFVWAGSDGGSGYRKTLEDQIEKNNLQDHIKMLGWIERKDMPSLYKCMDVYLHPALREPFGFAITEALMNEIPIVATKTGSTDLISHKENGYMLEFDDVEDIVSALEMLLSSDETRATMAKKGYEHALENLVFEKMWEGHINMYLK